MVELIRHHFTFELAVPLPPQEAQDVAGRKAEGEDIPLLAEHLHVQRNREDQLAVAGFTRQALALLEADPWPGNVRELERVVYRAVAVRRRGAVQPEDVKLPDSSIDPPGCAITGTDS